MSLTFNTEVAIALDGKLYAPLTKTQVVDFTHDSLKETVRSFKEVEYDFFKDMAILEYGAMENLLMAMDAFTVKVADTIVQEPKDGDYSTRGLLVTEIEYRCDLRRADSNINVIRGLSLGQRLMFLLNDKDAFSLIKKVGYPDLLLINGGNQCTKILNSFSDIITIDKDEISKPPVTMFTSFNIAGMRRETAMDYAPEDLLKVDSVLSAKFVGKPNDYRFGLEDIYNDVEIEAVPKIFLFLSEYLSKEDYVSIMASIKGLKPKEQLDIFLSELLAKGGSPNREFVNMIINFTLTKSSDMLGQFIENQPIVRPIDPREVGENVVAFKNRSLRKIK